MQDLSEFHSGIDYDCQYSHLYDDEITFIQHLITEHKLTSMLDLCCGTGIVTIPLSRLLSDTLGVDIHPAMLETAKGKRQGKDNVDFVQADACSFSAGRQFDLVIMTGNAFQAFLDEESVDALVNNVNRHLNAGGFLVFDKRLPIESQLALDEDWVVEKGYQDQNGDHVASSHKLAKYDEYSNIVYYEMQRTFADGTTRLTSIDLKFRSLEDIDRLLSKAGLSVIERFSSWKGNDLNADSGNLVCIARKSCNN
ncbi:SAM-dependent methyltransferase [Veronia nyctiphanis]|uniref:SAM-dependent methyltransferase n=1 Tax=Veronia nyctiphanis TaxID=1278244 RepID=A0A4Q0YU53_9GAMM|nr:class I SAM-dependent methyltransferase [Veronia nyctiphanis]RXJ72719.1 SAM-dependent methyltransferase [Veronia nyctiphanis]